MLSVFIFYVGGVLAHYCQSRILENESTGNEAVDNLVEGLSEDTSPIADFIEALIWPYEVFKYLGANYG